MEFSQVMNTFDILKDIITTKSGKLIEDPDFKKSFNNFMICRYLSMDRRFADQIAQINKLQLLLSSEEMYKYLVKVLPYQKSSFIKYISKPKKSKEKEDDDAAE